MIIHAHCFMLLKESLQVLFYYSFCIRGWEEFSSSIVTILLEYWWKFQKVSGKAKRQLTHSAFWDCVIQFWCKVFKLEHIHISSLIISYSHTSEITRWESYSTLFFPVLITLLHHEFFLCLEWKQLLRFDFKGIYTLKSLYLIQSD